MDYGLDLNWKYDLDNNDLSALFLALSNINLVNILWKYMYIWSLHCQDQLDSSTVMRKICI